ncbi:ribonuclease H-like domain-containing protein [Tanacetum coccineum]
MSSFMETYVKKKYALELLKCGNVLNDKPFTTLIDVISSLNLIHGEPLHDPSFYRTLVGTIINLTITRPDISFAVQLLRKFSQEPRTPHMKALLRVISGGGGDVKEKHDGLGKTDDPIGSYSQYEFPSLSGGSVKVTNDGNPNKNGLEFFMKEAPTSYANKLSPTSFTKANLQKLDAKVPNDADFDIWLPLDLVHKVNDRMKDSLYGYFIGKRLAFPVFSSTKGVDLVLTDGPWMIHEVPIFLNKWSPFVSLLKEELSRVLVWVKFHDVPLVVYTSDGLSLIANKIGTSSRKKTGKTNALTSSNGTFSLSNLFEVLNVDNLVEKISMFEQRPLKEKWVLVNDECKPLKKVDYTGDHDSEDEVEHVDNEMASYLTSKPSGVGYGTNSLLEKWRKTYGNADNDYEPYDDDMYEGQEIPNNIQFICDNLNIKVLGHKKN